MKIRLLALAALLALTQCKQEDVVPPRPALIIKTPELSLTAAEVAYPIDIDSNGFVDFNLLAHADAAGNKLIYRLQGVISSPYTTVVHGRLRELSEQQQCDFSYTSILEPTVFSSGDTIGEALPLQWYLIGDFHHFQICDSGDCACSAGESSVQYLPIAVGETAYLGVRFIIRKRKHYGWLEVSRQSASEYTIGRMAYNRFAGMPAPIP